MRKITKKKGVSPIVATSLLLALTLVLAAIIFMWAKGFVKEKLEKNGESAEYTCAQLKFDAEFTRSGAVANNQMPGVVQIVNRGSVPIYGFDIKQINGGTVVRTPFLHSVAAGETIPGKNVLLVGDSNSLEIYPILLAKVQNQKLNKQYTCLHNAEKFQIN